MPIPVLDEDLFDMQEFHLTSITEMSTHGSIEKFPEDPNRGRNRVPSLSELTTLRGLFAHNSRIADDLERQVTIAKEERGRIQLRYEERLRELESLKSELNASHRFVTLLEQQRASLNKENDQLKGLLHPIRRCPGDILRMIFEWTVRLDSDEWFQTATCISHVCRSWRTLALRLPLLWSHIRIFMTDSLDQTRNFVKAMSDRLGSIPPELVLDNFGDPASWEIEFSLPQFITACRIDSFQAIKSLCIRLRSAGDFDTFIKHSWRYRSLERLIIDTDEEEDEFPELNLTLLSTRFPGLKHIHVQHLNSRVFVEQDNAEVQSLFSLHLDQMDILDNCRLSTLVGLEELRLSDIACSLEPTGTIILPNLRKAVIHGVPPTIWHLFSFPSIQDVDINYLPDEALDFLCKHRSLRRLELRPGCRLIDQDIIGSLACALPDLTSLSVSFDIKWLLNWKDIHLTAPPFPNLSHLRTLIKLGELEREKFEAFVRARCLHGQRVDRVKRLETWDIVYYPNEEPVNLLWATSELLYNCTQETYTHDPEYKTNTMYTRWI